MNHHYRISSEAFNDLENIWNYTFDTWSEEQANRYYNLILEEIEYIATHFDEGRDMNYIKKDTRHQRLNPI